MLDEASQDHIGFQLRAMYAALTEAVVPDRLRDLLAQLEAATATPTEVAGSSLDRAAMD